MHSLHSTLVEREVRDAAGVVAVEANDIDQDSKGVLFCSRDQLGRRQTPARHIFASVVRGRLRPVCARRLHRVGRPRPGSSSTKLPKVVVEMTIAEDPPISPAHSTEIGLVRPTSIRRCVYELVDQLLQCGHVA